VTTPLGIHFKNSVHIKREYECLNFSCAKIITKPSGIAVGKKEQLVTMSLMLSELSLKLKQKKNVMSLLGRQRKEENKPLVSCTKGLSWTNK
jgi:hypothetical protein